MSVSDLKDCAHTDEELGGVCQYQGCAMTLCTECVKDCTSCGITICDEHTVWLDGGQTPFCPDCSGDHVKQKAAGVLIDRAIRRLRGGGA